MKIIAISLSVAFAFSSAALGQTFTLTTPGGTNQVNIMAGESFTLQITLDVSFQTTGASFFLETTSATAQAGSGLFDIASRNTTSSPYQDQNTPTLAGTDALLGPRTADLGGTTSTGGAVNPGKYVLSSFTILSNGALAPGLYTLRTASMSSVTLTGPNFDSVSVPTTSFTVQVVPEPGSASLLLGGVIALGVFRRQRSVSRHRPV